MKKMAKAALAVAGLVGAFVVYRKRTTDPQHKCQCCNDCGADTAAQPKSERTMEDACFITRSNADAMTPSDDELSDEVEDAHLNSSARDNIKSKIYHALVQSGNANAVSDMKLYLEEGVTLPNTLFLTPEIHHYLIIWKVFNKA